MEYYFSKTVNLNFNETVKKTIEILKQEGFGILTEIDVNDILKKKLGVNFKKYKILGACNPSLGYQALQAEENIGLMLPCNIIVKESGENKSEVVAINPVVSMMAVENPQLMSITGEVKEKLGKVIKKL